MSIEWVFDPAPPSGSRKGGNAAEYGFEGQIDTLVRETVQNSMDAGKPWNKCVEVRYRLVELTGDYRAAFLDAMSWDRLEDNLMAVPDKRGGKSIHQAIEEMAQQDRLLLLCIEDRAADGLTGEETRTSDDEINRFSALVRDELYSDKEAPDSGGSFGLGKILLWAYSSFKTVLFSSVPVSCPDEYSGLRFIGRTSLPYHETEEDGRCAGSGWLGIPADEGDGPYAKSVWGQEAVRYATGCCARREDAEYGLTTVIVGFEEPGELTRPVEEIIKSIRAAALESFWPALTENMVRISISHERDGECLSTVEADPLEDPAFSQLSQLLSDYREGRIEEAPSLESTGNSAVRKIPIGIPEKLDPEDPHAKFTGEVALLVRLVDDNAELDPVKDRIYRFRRLGMVVRYTGARSLSISARPYVAALLCGLASCDSDSDRKVEYYLRAAEPPEHDRWRADTRAIKENYKSFGAKKMLKEFEAAIMRAVNDLVSLPEKKGGELPKELLKHLRFGDSSGGGNPRFISSKISARADSGSWRFTIRCKRSRQDESPWKVRVRLKYAIDGGGSDDVHAIGHIESDEAVRSVIVKGDAFLEFPADRDAVTINGSTDPENMPAIGTRSAVHIYVDGQKGGIDDV